MLSFHLTATPYERITASDGHDRILLRITKSQRVGTLELDGNSLVNGISRNTLAALFDKAAEDLKDAGQSNVQINISHDNVRAPTGWKSWVAEHGTKVI